MANWKGNGDSRPSASRSKAGSIDCTSSPKKAQYIPSGSEAFPHKRGGKKSPWKGNSDSRP
jgi:hypothetical protein